MNKKVFFQIDNGDTKVTAELSGVLTQLEAECQDVKNNDDMDLYSWTITPIIMTDEEYAKLPEAY